MTARYSAIFNCLHALLPILTVLCLVQSGCKQAEKLGRIGGKVTFQGKPVTEGLVIFSCIEKGVNMNAQLKADGSYEIIMAKGAGLPLGAYRVSVCPPPTFYAIGEAQPTQPKAYPDIPKKYHSFESSGLTMTIKDGTNQFDIDMKP